MTPTQITILVVVALLIAYDLFAWWRWGSEGTLSVTLYEWAQRWPIIPFALGVLFGHLFWPV